MIVREINSKTILSNSQVYPYVVNPYVGCQHACSYCYARFMKRFTGHQEPWGEFVDVKINAPELLRKEIIKKPPAKVWVSGVCDPYQPLEARYQLTRQCLEILAQHDWPVVIQTRSPLVLRDIEIIQHSPDFEVGLTITTADDDVRKLFEPLAPPIPARLRALEALHQAGIKTYAMIAPMLPGAEDLPDALAGKVDYVLVDRMNYTHAGWVYAKYGLQDKCTEEYFQAASHVIAAACANHGIECRVVF